MVDEPLSLFLVLAAEDLFGFVYHGISPLALVSFLLNQVLYFCDSILVVYVLQVLSVSWVAVQDCQHKLQS